MYLWIKTLQFTLYVYTHIKMKFVFNLNYIRINIILVQMLSRKVNNIRYYFCLSYFLHS